MALIPDRSPCDYKDNKIWTELCWSSADIPKSWVVTKFNSTMYNVPFYDKWIIWISDDEDCSANFLASCFGASTLEEHKRVIDALSTLKKQDRFAFSYIAVMDARHEVIGENHDPHELYPFLVGDEITSGKRIHRTKEDGVFDEHYKQNQRNNATGAVILAQKTIGPRKYFVYQCRESNSAEDTFVLYPRKESQTITNPWSFPDKMKIVHKDHMSWLLEQGQVFRDMFSHLRMSYSSDVMLDERMMDRFVKVLHRKFARGERIIYQLQQPDKAWCDLMFDDQITANHNEHRQMLLQLTDMSHTLHRRWSKIYQEDLFMDPTMRESLTRIINQLFGIFLDKVHDDPSSNLYHVAHRYFVEEIPVNRSELPPLVPYDLW